VGVGSSVGAGSVVGVSVAGAVGSAVGSAVSVVVTGAGVGSSAYAGVTPKNAKAAIVVADANASPHRRALRVYHGRSSSSVRFGVIEFRSGAGSGADPHQSDTRRTVGQPPDP
jgi:hypothetical protein